MNIYKGLQIFDTNWLIWRIDRGEKSCLGLDLSQSKKTSVLGNE